MLGNLKTKIYGYAQEPVIQVNFVQIPWLLSSLGHT